MAQLSFGTILRNERERKGHDLTTVARKLRIRPDILQSIEASDFTRMPPRGYARNMVNAYARFLGLNPTEVTRMYLDEAYAEQVKKARVNVQGTGFDMSNAPGSRRTQQGRREPTQDDNMRYDNASGRMLYVENNTSRYRNAGNDIDRLYSEERMHRSTRSAVPGTQYTNFYAGPKAPGSLLSRLPLIIGALIILILVVILLFYFFGPKPDGGDGVQNVPVTGVDNPTQTDDGNDDSPIQPVEVAPEKAVFTYEVAEGGASWIEMYYNNGENPEFGQTVTGPATDSLDVIGVLEFTTANPGPVKVYVDGVAAELTPDPDQTGYYKVTVDFPSILAQWHINHPSPASNTGTTDSTDNTDTNAETNDDATGTTS